MRILIAGIVAVALSACSTTGVVQTAQLAYAVTPPELIAAAAPVQQVMQPVVGSTSLGSVDAYACQKLNYDPQPTDELAITMLRAEAAKRGATSVAEVKVTRSNIDLARNCFTTIHASGVAYR